MCKTLSEYARCDLLNDYAHSGVIISENFEGRVVHPADSHLGKEREEVSGSAKGILPNQAGGVCACRTRKWLDLISLSPRNKVCGLTYLK